MLVKNVSLSSLALSLPLFVSVSRVYTHREKVSYILVAEVRHILLDPVTAVRDMSGERGREKHSIVIAIQLKLPLTSQSDQSRWCRGSLPSLSAACDHHLPGVPTVLHTLTKTAGHSS